MLFNLILLNVTVGFSEKVSANENDTSNAIYEEEDFSDLLNDAAFSEEELDILQEDFEEELEIFHDSEIEVDVASVEETNIELVASTEVNDTNIVLDIDMDEASIALFSNYEENGKLISKNYEVVVTLIDGEDFSADFIDKETGEVWSYSTTEATASVVPAVVYFLGGQLLRVSIKTVSKNLLKNSLKIGNKVYKANSNKVAKNALSKVGFKSAKFKLGNTGKYVSLSKGRFEHILQRHHPKYWNGTFEGKQSFFDPKTSLKTIQNYIKQTISSNSKTINSKVNGLKGKKGKVEVIQKINGTKYKLVLNVDEKKSITVSTFFPVVK